MSLEGFKAVIRLVGTSSRDLDKAKAGYAESQKIQYESSIVLE
jgi:hypothetical protein